MDLIDWVKQVLGGDYMGSYINQIESIGYNF